MWKASLVLRGQINWTLLERTYVLPSEVLASRYCRTGVHTYVLVCIMWIGVDVHK